MWRAVKTLQSAFLNYATDAMQRRARHFFYKPGFRGKILHDEAPRPKRRIQARGHPRNIWPARDLMVGRSPTASATSDPNTHGSRIEALKRLVDQQTLELAFLKER